MKQTKLMSFIEVFISSIIKFVIALQAQIILLPLYGMEATLNTNFQLVTWFTVISIGMSYILRRLFENNIVQTVVTLWYSARVYFFKKKRMKEVQNTAFQDPQHINCTCTMEPYDHNRHDKDLF